MSVSPRLRIADSTNCFFLTLIIFVVINYQDNISVVNATSPSLFDATQYSLVYPPAVAKSFSSKAITFWWWLGVFEWPLLVKERSHGRLRSDKAQNSAETRKWDVPASDKNEPKPESLIKTYPDNFDTFKQYNELDDVDDKKKIMSKYSYWNKTAYTNFIRLLFAAVDSRKTNYASDSKQIELFKLKNNFKTISNDSSINKRGDVSTLIELEKTKLEHRISDRPKRTYCCNTMGKCSVCLEEMDAEEVVDHYTDFFADVPKSLVSFSDQGRSQQEHCHPLSVPLFPVELQSEILHPWWIRNVTIMGWCPSVLVTRSLGPHVFPSKVVEQHCLCLNKKCSNNGVDFRCVSVHRNVSTWVRHPKGNGKRKAFEPQSVQVRVGCVCMQRPGLWAGNINSPYAMN